METVFWLELAIQMKERSSPPPPPSCWSQGTLVQALEHLSLSTWLPSSHSSPSSTLPSPQAGGGSPVVASVVASVSLVETISVVEPVAVVVASVAESLSVTAVVAVVEVVASVAESLSVPAVVVAVSDSPAVPAVVPAVVAAAVVPAVVAVAVVSSVALLVSSPLHAVPRASVSAVRSWIEVVGR
ncbi:MAG: hypothetical protein IPK80_30795 [Nannocystis sp.]|nr:hypothetical protein [Nannocystis sp.]